MTTLLIIVLFAMMGASMFYMARYEKALRQIEELEAEKREALRQKAQMIKIRDRVRQYKKDCRDNFFGGNVYGFARDVSNIALAFENEKIELVTKPIENKF